MPDDSAPPLPVLVVGAGPTGLVLALWLTKAGVRVRIIDKAATAGTASRAVAIQARTMEFYRQLGIAHRVEEADLRVNALNLWANGKRRAHVSMRQLGAGLSPFPEPATYAQDEHERMLIDALQSLGVAVERERELAAFTQQGDAVEAVVRDAHGGEERIVATYLAGCDGAHSRTRELIGASFPGSTYSGVFYVADVIAHGRPVDGGIHVEVDDADFLALFPLRGAGRLRLIGPVTWDLGAPHADVTFESVRARANGRMGLVVDAAHWFSTYRVHHRVANRFRDRRVFLLGDAAHVHSPVGGQGMNTGIGDAVNLAWKLADVVHGRAASALLDSYEPERIAFARKLVATTDRVFTIVTRQGPIARIVRTRIAPRVVALAMRFSFVRRAAFALISQIGIEYRGSALSRGRAGTLRGGDRLPWVPLGTGADNFDPLTSRDWQVHVYGNVGDDVRAWCTSERLALHQFPYSDKAKRAGIARDAVHLVRPDGYIALIATTNPAAALNAYRHAAPPRQPRDPRHESRA